MQLLALELTSILGYFWPEKPAARFVVEIETLLAALWLVALLAHAMRIRRASEVTQKLDGLIPLLETDVLTRSADQSSIVQARHAFAVHLAPAGINPRHPVAEHIQAIFTAGYCDSHLETAELVRKTEEEVCRLDGFTRTTIGLFVILGLLGTLFGVADAVNALTLAEKPSIQDFLGELRGAFAPSLLGVAISIAWVILYATVALPLRSQFRVLLRERTVREWLPRLRPSTSQRITEAAQHTLAAARRVVEFAAGIEENSQRWNLAVGASAEAAVTISGAMSEMSSAVGSARTVVDATLSELGQKLQAFSVALGEWNSIRDRIAEFQAAVAEFQRQQTETESRIRDHADRLNGTTESLRKELKESLEGLQGAAANLFVPVSTAAQDLKTIGADFAKTSGGVVDGLKTELAAQIQTLQLAHQQGLDAVRGFFITMSGELRTKGDDFVRQLQNLKEPFENAAGNLRDAAATSVTQWNTMIQDFNRRIDNLIAAVRETHAVAPLPPEPFLNAQRWEELMKQLAKLQAQPGTQAVVDALGRIYDQLGLIRERLSNVSLVPSAPSNPPRRPVPDFGVGERISTVALPRGRRRDD